MEKIKQKLKIKASLWDDIISGKKKFEFRKLSKGLVSDLTLMYDMDTEDLLGVMFIEPDRVFLKNINMNVEQYKFYFNNVDEESIKFINDNYIDKFDFISFEILEAKDLRKEHNV